jgi:hypothetical protein
MVVVMHLVYEPCSASRSTLRARPIGLCAEGECGRPLTATVAASGPRGSVWQQGRYRSGAVAFSSRADRTFSARASTRAAPVKGPLGLGHEAVPPDTHPATAL